MGMVNQIKMDDEEVKLRTHRSKSWMRRAKGLAPQDLDGQFIFGWIALNALYGQPRYLEDVKKKGDEFKNLLDFLGGICDIPEVKNKIDTTLYSVEEHIAGLFQNQFLLKKYWQDGLSDIVQSDLRGKSKSAARARENGNTHKYLELICERLYVLRNQLFHGCATDNSSSNRDSLENAVPVLVNLVSVLNDAVLTHGHLIESPGASYPPFKPYKSTQHPLPKQGLRNAPRIIKKDGGDKL